MEKKWVATIVISFIVVFTIAGVLVYSWYFNNSKKDNRDDDSDKILENNFIFNHNHAHKEDLERIPFSWINITKDNLHITYWHTSHGSQLLTGMDYLDTFMGDLNYYEYSSISEFGKMHLEDIDGYDLTHNPDDWFQITRDYLNNPSHIDTNVVMWSWCDPITEENKINYYLNNMTQLEQDFPNVKFVYMTHHVDGFGENGPGNKANEIIRDYCIQNNKILYDFADIESYDPDDNYFLDKNVQDTCDYDSGNWAIEWTSKPGIDLDEDWYDCSPAHTHAVNGNLKAYGAWFLFARIAGWDGN